MLNVQLWVNRVKCCFSSFFLFYFRQNPKARASSITTSTLKKFRLCSGAKESTTWVMARGEPGLEAGVTAF